MSGKGFGFYKWAAITILTGTVFCQIRFANAGEPSIREGHDFTIVAADAEYKAGELLVRFAPKTTGQEQSLAEKRQILTSLGGATLEHNFKLVPGLTLVKLPAGQTVKDALKTYNGKEGILYAEPNYKLRFGSTVPYDPNFTDQWGLHNTLQNGGTSDADIDGPEAWDIHTGSSDIIVAVIDSGVDYNHPDLNDNMWVNEAEFNGTPGVDDDNNLKIDDILGWNFDPNNNDPMDDLGHGTMCAGIVGTVGNNNEGLTGVCWDVKIMALNIETVASGWEPFVANACKAIEYAVDEGAQVLNASWGDYEYNQALKDKIYYAGEAGAILVACAHNEDKFPQLNNDVYPIYPASYDCNNIISVLATDVNDEKASWSHYGANSVDLGAPGSDIWECTVGGGYDDEGSGTSAATPHVAGACALVWSVNPELSHLEVKEIILSSVDKIPALEGLCVTGGRLNLYNAVVEAASRGYRMSVADDVNEGESVSPGDKITYTISFDANLTNIEITDYLPDAVDCNDTNDPNYNRWPRSYTWNIGTPGPNDPNSVELTVVVNNLAEPTGRIVNLCFIDANEIDAVPATEVTDVNCWGSGTVYVNAAATGGRNTGVSWADAYVNGSGASTLVDYSDVEGGEGDVYVGADANIYWGEGNIDAEPLFVEGGYWDTNGTPNDVNDDFWVEGDYHLQEGSPCIDAGDPNYIPEPNETDLDGKPRIVNDRVDMGAYEYESVQTIEAVVEIRPRTLNLRSKGRWIMCVIRLPEDYNVADIDPNSILLEDEIEADRVWLGDEFTVAKFSRRAVQEILAELETPAEVELVVSGELSDGSIFEGTDTIRVIDKGKRRNNLPVRAGRRAILKRKSTKGL